VAGCPNVVGVTDSNPEQALSDIENAFEESKANRLITKNVWDAAKGRFHMTLIARRESGEKLTIADMEAMEACAINDVDDVRAAYLDFIEADSKYRSAKVKWESAKRKYWDGKDLNR
jgi:hypothetical protein